MKNSIVILAMLALIIVGCDKDNMPIEMNPKNAILGKWEITHLGSTPIENPISYSEYLFDSILIVYNYEEKKYYNQKYWIKDSILYETYDFIDAIDNDTIIFVHRYKFQFLDKNSLRLDFLDPALIPTSFHKRIN
ncbi:hypothetical protein KFZ70_02940 [Tamlana fucoidanivorans]|uniref:Lipocalin-like domain-containing protein n=1 Tax=Allotamlana fucoidanivorans TaxID=2583814 RepID=A0A5C4SEF6_9FLAO|nr:hypothetical protein [Tamlana fucoidanivorans]TNJ41936.1 hypothetical protein FGF67_15370 [Tamlana fucoidanivorans]